MKLGVFTFLFADRAVEAGLDCVEIGTGNYPGDAHCRPAELLADETALDGFRWAVDSRGLEIGALSCHGNPLHPRAEVAKASHETFLRTVELAGRLGVGRINLSSRAAPATYPGDVRLPTSATRWSSRKANGGPPAARRLLLNPGSSA